jgi:hypothetical protein
MCLPPASPWPALITRMPCGCCRCLDKRICCPDCLPDLAVSPSSNRWAAGTFTLSGAARPAKPLCRFLDEIGGFIGLFTLALEDGQGKSGDRQMHRCHTLSTFSLTSSKGKCGTNMASIIEDMSAGHPGTSHRGDQGTCAAGDAALSPQGASLTSVNCACAGCAAAQMAVSRSLWSTN